MGDGSGQASFLAGKVAGCRERWHVYALDHDRAVVGDVLLAIEVQIDYLPGEIVEVWIDEIKARQVGRSAIQQQPLLKLLKQH